MLYLDLSKIKAGVNGMQMNHDGVAGNCTSATPSPLFIPTGTPQWIHEGKMGVLTGGSSKGSITASSPATLIANGLFTCAAVVITAPGKYALYHAESGEFESETLKELVAQVGDAAAWKVIYAIPVGLDGAYETQFKKLIGAGVASNNLIILSNVGGSFAVNELGIVG